MMPTTALIDGDIILYSVGHASENRYYTLSDTSGKVVARLRYASECKLATELDDTLTRELVREPVESKVWKGNTNSLVTKILEETGCEEYEMYLTGSGNFREKLVDDYKAHRKEDSKPLMYKEMKEWLIGRHNAIVIDGREADDELATRGYTDPTTVICTTDKDLRMVPAQHYNWVKNERFEVDELGGVRWFFKQVLMGDKADNIHGLKGIGPKTADKLIDPLTDPAEMLHLCLGEYHKQDRGDLDIIADLLWMQRTGPACKWDTYLEIEGN